MSKLDAICVANNIQYWLSYGSLVGTLSRSGFIPWDDDIDICMLRSDVDKLTAALIDDPEYQITLVYDWFVKSAVKFAFVQLIRLYLVLWTFRFTTGRPRIPSARTINLGNLRIELMDFFDKNEHEFSFWKDNPGCFIPTVVLACSAGDVDLEAQRTVVSSAEIDLVQSVFDSFNEKAHALGLLTDEPHGDFAYAIDNVFDAPKRKIIWDRNDILPVRKHPFGGFSFSVPAKAEKVADACYPGWPYMPMDICGHDHFAKDVLSDPDVRPRWQSLSTNVISSYNGFD